MSEYKCPLCGKNVVNDEPFCRDCQQIAESSYSENLIGKKLPKRTTQTSAKKKSDYARMMKQHPGSRKPYFVVLVGVLVCIAIGAISTYAYFENKQAEQNEVNLWNMCEAENFPSGYSKYLAQYPDGQFTGEAHTRMLELREQEQKEWLTVRRSKDLSTYFTFLSDHPDSPYEKEVRQTIDSLSWELAVEENSMKSYLIYIDNVSSGNFGGEYKELALERYEYLTRIKTIEGDEKEAIQIRMIAFLKALSSNRTKEILPFMAPVMAEYDGVKNEKRAAIVSILQAEIKNKKIKSITYTLPADSLSVVQDMHGLYMFTLPIEKQVTYIDKKKRPEVSRYSVDVELNEKMELSRLNPNVEDKS